MKSTSLYVGDGGVSFNSVSMNRKEQREAAERAKNLLLLAAAGAGLYLLTRPSEPREPNPELTADAKFNREVRMSLNPVYLAGGGNYTFDNGGLAGFLGALINDINLELPAYPVGYYRNGEVPGVLAKLDQMQARHGVYIDQAARLTKVPALIIKAFMFVESEGEEKAFNRASQATGLMQITPVTPPDILYREFVKKRITQEEIAVLLKHMTPDRLAWLRQNKEGQKMDVPTMFKPEVNILLGAMLIGQLMDEHFENGVYRMDKVLARYNNSYYFRKRGKTLVGPIAQVMTLVPAETKNYVKKLLGPNGSLTLLSEFRNG